MQGTPNSQLVVVLAGGGVKVGGLRLFEKQWLPPRDGYVSSRAHITFLVHMYHAVDAPIFCLLTPLKFQTPATFVFKIGSFMLFLLFEFNHIICAYVRHYLFERLFFLPLPPEW